MSVGDEDKDRLASQYEALNNARSRLLKHHARRPAAKATQPCRKQSFIRSLSIRRAMDKALAKQDPSTYREMIQRAREAAYQARRQTSPGLTSPSLTSDDECKSSPRRIEPLSLASPDKSPSRTRRHSRRQAQWCDARPHPDERGTEKHKAKSTAGKNKKSATWLHASKQRPLGTSSHCPSSRSEQHQPSSQSAIMFYNEL
jgi:hypothetical protein